MGLQCVKCIQKFSRKMWRLNCLKRRSQVGSCEKVWKKIWKITNYYSKRKEDEPLYRTNEWDAGCASSLLRMCVFLCVCVCVRRGQSFRRLKGGQAEVTPHLVCSTAWWEIWEQRRRKSERDREGGRGQPVITIVWVIWHERQGEEGQKCVWGGDSKEGSKI